MEVNANMNRRGFLRAAGTLPASLAFAQRAARPAWKTFEITTRIEVLKPSGATRVWTPVALIADTPWQKTLANTYRCDGASARLLRTTADSMGVVAAEFSAGAAPILTVVSRVATRDRFMAMRQRAPPDFNTGSAQTSLLPLDGIVGRRALEITRSARTDFDKAQAIYEWIVENTSRNPRIRGCGLGNIRFMLESGDLSGKCADINALYVGLARLFGSWEGNWMAYNFAHDVALPGSSSKPLGYLMYPQAETAEGRVDCPDPDHFRYEIAAREIPQNV